MPPRTAMKINYLIMRHLHFGSVRGDLQEGHGCASRCQFLLFLCRSPFLPSTKSRFLCALGVCNPCFRAFRAQNRGFCALFAFGTPIFGLFKHKNRLFVLFCPPEPPILGFSSTKSRFLCAFGVWNPCFRAFRAQNWHFCAREAEKAALGSQKISVYT